MTKIAFKTLGCRVNLYETDALASRFKAAGYETADSDADADPDFDNDSPFTRARGSIPFD